MAFPASPSNNDVHKEGNRAFVYDSALGVWDQVRESDSLVVDFLPMRADTTVLTSSDTFPAGHVLQVVNGKNNTQIGKNDTAEFVITTATITPTNSSSKFLVKGVVMGVQAGTTTSARLNIYLQRNGVTKQNSGANFWIAIDYRQGGFAIEMMDRPGGTSTITYALAGGWPTHSSVSYVNKDGNSGYSTISVMEIAG